MSYELFSVGSVICNAFCIFMLCTVLREEHLNWKKCLIFSFGVGSILGSMYLLIGSETLLYVVSSLAIYFGGLCIAFRSGFLTKLFSLVTFYIACALAELVFFYIYILSMEIPLEEVQKSISLNSGPLLLGYAIVFVMVFMLRHIKAVMLTFRQAKYPPFFILAGIAPIVIIVAYFSFLNALMNSMSKNGIILVSVLSVFMSLTMFLIFIGMLDLQFRRSIENKYNAEYAKNVKSLLSDLREFRHDFNNILNGFKGCVLSGDIDEIRRYIGDMEEDFVPANKNLYNIGYIQNPAVFGCVLKKVEKLKDLNTEINILNEITLNTELDAASLCRIFGILFDNAIEAAVQSTKKKIYVNIFEDSQMATIIMKNSFEGEINMANLQTTKGENRGVGLFSLNKILAKNKNILHSTFIDQDGLFTQQITIPIK